MGARPISVLDLARLTGCSAVTIRRDLTDLAGRGLLRRVHGGAVAVDRRGTPMPYAMRADQHTTAKAAIARVVAELVQDDASVVLDNGSTIVAVADELAGHQITAMCLSLRAASALSRAPEDGSRSPTRIATPGGAVSGDSLEYGGASCLEALAAFRADVAVLGACSASPAHGLSVTTSEDARIKRAILASSMHVILAATGDKLSRTSSFRFGSLEQVDDLVTTVDVPDAALADIRAAGVRVHIAR